jgi:Lysozyme like domain/LysM domain
MSEYARNLWRAALLSLGLGALVAVAALFPWPRAGPVVPARSPAPYEPLQADTHHVRLTAAEFTLTRLAGRAITMYRIRAGDTLSGIAGRFCGNPGDYPSLAAANGIQDPNVIMAGAVIRIACHAAYLAATRASPSGRGGGAVARPAATVTSFGGTLGCAGLEALWDAAGGARDEAFVAAEVAMAESGGRQFALSPTNDYGYWQINGSHGPALATFNPLGNARAAIIISDDGRNWSAWTTYTDGAYAGRC